MRILNSILAAIATATTALTLSPGAEADDASYLQYLTDHGYGLSIGPAVGPNSPMVGTGIIPFPDKTLSDGHMLCDRLNGGASYQQLESQFGSQPYWHPVIDAAQQELCPETR